jgi:hypothetical protein
LIEKKAPGRYTCNKIMGDLLVPQGITVRNEDPSENIHPETSFFKVIYRETQGTIFIAQFYCTYSYWELILATNSQKIWFSWK